MNKESIISYKHYYPKLSGVLLKEYNNLIKSVYSSRLAAYSALENFINNISKSNYNNSITSDDFSVEDCPRYRSEGFDNEDDWLDYYHR